MSTKLISLPDDTNVIQSHSSKALEMGHDHYEKKGKEEIGKEEKKKRLHQERIELLKKRSQMF